MNQADTPTPTPMPKPTLTPTSRRGMLFGAVAAGSAAVAVVALPKAAPQEVVAQTLKPAPARGGGYQLTDHVKQYYSTTLI